jgi:hypothetical protein
MPVFTGEESAADILRLVLEDFTQSYKQEDVQVEIKIFGSRVVKLTITDVAVVTATVPGTSSLTYS